MGKKRKTKGKRKKSGKRQAKQPDADLFPFPDMRALEGGLFELPFGEEGLDEDSPLAQAQEIMYEAFDTEGPRQVKLARKALDICPDCADAYVLLAEHAASLPEAIELLRAGEIAGRRALGEATFREHAGHFWGLLQTRPYMRVKLDLAHCLYLADQREEAVAHFEEALRLNPMDNQGIRWVLAKCLIELNRLDDLEVLLKQYEEDATANWTYTKTLLTFRREGPSEKAQSLLTQAAQHNEYVPRFLLGDVEMPLEMPEFFSPGEEDEAALYAAEFLPAWKATPGAITWLRQAAGVGLPMLAEPPPRTLRELRDEVLELPQAEGEVWQIDFRRMPASCKMEGEKRPPWAAMVVNCATGEVPALDTFDRRPGDEELWELLTDAMLEPECGEAHLPELVQVTTKQRCRAWTSNLADLDIACHYLKPLEHASRALDQFDQFLPKGLGLSGSTAVVGDVTELKALPQSVEEVWQADTLQMHTWIDVDDAPSRPWLVLVTDRTRGLILAYALCEQQPPAETLRAKIAEAMRTPCVEAAHRPGVVQVRSEDHRHLAGPLLEELNVRCEVCSSLDQLDNAFETFADQLIAGPQIPALIEVPGLGPEQVGCYFEAAGQFYLRAPWQKVAGDTVIKIECDKFDSGPWYAVVMGQSGMTMGLALYDDAESLRTLLSGELSDEEASRRTSALSVTFDEEFAMAIPDLEAAEQFGWPVATPEAYPCAMRVNPGRTIRPPLAWELELLEGCLLAIPEFLAAETPTQRTNVRTASGELKLVISWPDEATV